MVSSYRKMSKNCAMSDSGSDSGSSEDSETEQVENGTEIVDE